MHEAAYVLAAFALGSQLLALVRDRLLASTFGASETLDVYYAAFRIPDFLFATVASLLSLYALLPVLSRLEQKHQGLVVSFLRQALFVFFVVMGVVAGVLYIAAPWVVPWVVPGIAHPDLVTLVRILLLQPILLGASNVIAALTQMRHRFFLYAVSPLLYNIGIIVGVVALYPYMGIAGLGWGVVLGAALHLLVQLPFFCKEKTQQTLPVRAAGKELLGVLALSLPRTLTLSAGQLSLLLLVGVASYFTAGSIAVFMFAYSLQAVPLTIIGVSYSVAAFPTLASLHAAGERAAFARYVEVALRHIFFWSIPATIMVVVLRAQLVRVILGAGAFSWDATRLTAAALALFIVSLAAQSATMLIARAYYAAGNTRKPLYFAAAGVLTTVGSALLFVQVFLSSDMVRAFVETLLRVNGVPGTVVLMLALGAAVGASVQFVYGFVLCMRDFNLSRSIYTLLFQSFAASVIGGAVAYGVLAATGAVGTINTALGLIVQGAMGGVAGLLTTALVLWLLGNQELAETLGAFKRRFGGTPPQLETTDISS